MKLLYPTLGSRVFGYLFLPVIFLCFSLSISAQTTLGPGDVAFTQANMDDDGFALVLLTDVVSGTSFVITDNEYDSSSGGLNNTNEGILRVTFNVAFSCGDEFLFNSPSGSGGDFTVTPAANVTLVEVSGNIQLSTSGDALIAYQETMSGDVYLAALNNSGGNFGDGVNNPPGNIDLPPGLTDGQTAVSIDNGGTEFDNVRYLTTANTIGDATTLATNINTRSNWEGRDDPEYPVAAYGFSCNNCDDPVITSLSQNPAGPTCPTASVNIMINGMLNDGTGWFLRTGSDNGPIVDGPANTTQFTVIPGETTTYFVTATGCTSNTISESITITTIGEAADAGPDQFFVSPMSSATLAANDGSPQNGMWTIVDGDGSGMFIDDTSPTTDFNGTAGQSYLLSWTLSGGSCATTSDTVEISFAGPTTLAVGDLAFTGYNSTDPDEWSFVLLTDVGTSTTIIFTDNGWLASGGFRQQEGTVDVTFQRNYGCGSTFYVSETGPNTFTVFDSEGNVAGFASAGGDPIQISLAGDQLFAFQGNINTPTLLAGIQMNGDWDADAIDGPTSAQPPALMGNNTSLAIDPEMDNAQYNCSTVMGEPEQLRAAINDPANWNSQDITSFDLSMNCPFACGVDCTMDTDAPTISDAQGLDCGDTFQAQTGFDYIITDEDAPFSGVSTAVDCRAGIRLRAPRFQDACGIDSIYVNFTAAAGTPIAFNDPRILSVSLSSEDPNMLNPGTVDTNFVFEPNSFLFYGSADGTPATTRVTYEVYDAAGNMDSCSIFIEVTDNQAPLITSCPTLPDSLFLDGNCMATTPDYTVANGTVLANSSMDFSGTQGQNGWFYGRNSAFDVANFSLLPNFSGFVWNTAGSGENNILDFAQLDPNGGHPQFEGLVWAVRRWVSDFTGEVTVSGDFFDRDTGCGDGANVRIFQNGVQVYEFLDIPSTSTPYSIDLTVAAGDEIDFAIDPKFEAPCDDTHFVGNISVRNGIEATDNCSAVTISQFPAAGSPLSAGDTIVRLIATDESGNADTCAVALSVQDTIPPTVTCPADITVDNDMGQCGANVSFAAPLANDNCPGVSASASPASGSFFAVGTTSVTVTATDASGNMDDCTFNVTVNDTEAPTANCPINIIASNDPGVCNAVVNYTIPAPTDNCPGVTSMADLPPGSAFEVGTTTVTVTATDAGGLTGTCTFTVTINDTEVPDAECVDGLDVFLDDMGMAMISATDIDNGSTDNCGTPTLVLSDSTFTCADAGMTQLVVLTATDAASNSDTCQTPVMVMDTMRPVVTCETAIDVALEASDSSFMVSGVFIASDILISFEDNCAAEPATIGSLPGTQTVFTCDDAGLTFTSEFRFSDGNGNIRDCSTEITVTDPLSLCNQPPMAVCMAVEVNADENCLGMAVAEDFDGGSFDDDGDMLTFSIDPMGPFGAGVTNVSLIVSDGQLSDTCMTTITVIDDDPPVITNCPEDIFVPADEGECSAIVSWPELELAPDPCSTAPVDTSLQAILDRYTNQIDLLLPKIVGRYSIEEDFSGNNSFSDGGNDVYDGGNEMNTNFEDEIDYSEQMVTNSDDFGPGSAYFTSYNQGVWMMAANLVDVTFYEISGNNGADQSGIAAGYTTTYTSPRGNTYYAFVKRVFHSNDPSINHLIIVPNNPAATQTFETDTNDDEHIISDLDGSDRIYQFNWYGNISRPYTDEEIDDVFQTFVDLIIEPQTTIVQIEGPQSGSTLTAGDTSTVTFIATDPVGNMDTCSFNVAVFDDQLPMVDNCTSDTMLFVTADDCSVEFEFEEPVFTDNCAGTAYPPLDSVLANYQNNIDDLLAVIPNRFELEDDIEENAFFDDGGGDTYDEGNVISTSFADTIYYSELVVANDSAGFGPGGSYFTGYNEGVWMLAADMVGVDEYAIQGELGADGDGFVNNYVSTYTFAGVTYYGYLKRVFNNSDPSINHIIIVPDVSTGVQAITTADVEDDFHALSNIRAASRLYQFNWYGEESVDDGYEYTDAEAQAIFEAFVEFVAAPGLPDSTIMGTQTAGPASGEAFAVGDTRVTFEASDAAGNLDSCSFVVTVLDTIRPFLDCNSPRMVFLDDDGVAVVPVDIDNFQILADDNCEIDSSSFAEVSGLTELTFDCDDVFADTSFMFTIDDVNGNTSDACTVEIIINDNIAPVITCPADATIECDEDTAPFMDGGTQTGTAMGTVEAGTLGWTDGTTGTIGNLTSSIGGIPAGATVTDVNLTIQADHTWSGDLNLRLISPDGTELQFLDNVVCPTSGNTDNADVTFDDEAGPFNCTVVSSDTGNPEDCTEDYLVAAGISGVMQPEMGSLSVFDGETAAGDWMLNIMDDVGGDGGCFYTFRVEVSWTAASDETTGNPELGFATATDNCSAELSFQDSSTQVLDGSCDEFSYEIFRTFIATDPSGNADTCVQTITVEDTQAPDLICTTVEVVMDDDLGNIELDDTDLDRVIAGTTDNCDPGFTAEFSQTEFDCSDIDPETNQITVDVLAADACGNDTMCTVQLDVMPQALDYDFACITEINVTLDADCSAELVPEMVLSGEFICLDLFDFEIVVMDDDPTNGAIIDGCGTFQYSITEVSEDFDAANFETCWGFVNAEDKTSPELEEDGEIVAPAPLYCDDLARINVNELPNGVSRCWIQSGQTGQTLNGSMNPALRQRLLAGGGIPNFVDGCSDVEICVNDQVENIGACEDMTITRIFTARDGISCEAEAGEENAPTVYSYEIIFTRPTIDDVDAITPTAEFECNDVLDLLPPNQFGDENPTPEFDDFPFFDDGSGPVYLTESFCNLGATFRDGPRIVTCENTYKFVRTFTVIDWCEPETIRDFTQLVKVGDFDAPVITAPTQDLNFNGIPDQEEGLGPIFFSTSNPDCSANFIIPAGDADDNCDDNPEVIALIYPNGNTDGAAVGPFQVGGPAFGIPVGVHTLRYIARDACDNADTLDVPLEVGDRTAPVAICENGLDISLGGAGQAQLCGEDIDQASYDECSDITRLIAFVGANNLPLNDAQTLALTGIAQGGWRECITLTCELLDDDPDSPDFVSVGLLVTDASQNSNSCWLDVLVEDKLPPLCVAPGPVTTTCDDEDILSLPQDLNQAAQDDPTTTFAQLDQIFGSANGLDNCPDFDITQMVVDTRNSCGVGQILRSFFVTDGEGFNSTNPCSQTITVLGIHDYTIRFPEDFGSEACVEPDYDGVTFEERGCDLITTTTRIDTFEATADECYKLRITYEVLNWCEYSTEADPYEVPRDADNDDFLEEPTWVHVLPRDESTLSDDIAYLDSDANRFNGFISPLDLHDPNGQVFGASTQPYGTDESRGAFLYRQFIKVYDDVAPEVTDVTGDLVFEDEDGNCAEPVVLTIEVDDECTTEEDYTATAQLDPFFEDIDLDGILTLADFVPTADPSLQPNVVNNNDGTFTVSFNVELPLGRHAVRLRATDGCGNAETILIIFEVIDDKAPTPVCINGLTATLMPDGNGGGMAAIWASEYVVSGGEDCTGPVKFAIYHPDDFEALDNGTLIPNVIDTGIVLDCDDEGMLIVRVYAIDGNGNADYCETTLSVQAFQPNTCEGGDDGGNIFGLIESPAGTATPNVEVSISDDGSMSQMNVTDQSGEYSFTELALGEDYTIEPTLEAEVNVATAVTTFDILLINRHILAIAELESPYQHVVADVNMDGQINVLDVVHIRMVIMGQRTDYPQGPTWRFADRDYAFSADPGNWASEAFAELHNINDLPGDILGADFYALEMGNVSEGVIAENGLLPEDGEARSRAVLTTESLQLTAGNSYELPFRAADLYGFQGTLELAAGLELMDITYGALHAQHVNLEAAAEGLIALSYDEVAGTTTEELFRLTVRATRDGALSELLSLTDRMTRAEGYPLSGGVADLNLDFTTAPLAADEFSLGQNAPNPVDRATQIAFTLPRAATATLTVRDVQGRTLLVREIEAGAGTNLLTLRREELGAAGVLSYTLTAGEFTATKQMVIR